jgi:hypothetical protein
MLNQEEGDTRGQVAGFIKQLKDIFECSVVVGLKITPQMYHKIKGNDKHCLHAYMTKKTEEMGLFEQNMPEEGVEVFEPSHEIIVQCAGDFEYPIFRHTSCAVSYLQHKADYNGTMWRDDICPPHSYCPKRQQDLCREFKKSWDYGKFKNEITALSNTNVINHSDCIEIIEEPVSQENLNSLTHIFGKAAFSKSIRFSLVWPGSNQKYFWNKYGRRPQY